MPSGFRLSPARTGRLALVLVAAVVGFWISNASAGFIACTKTYTGSGDWSDTSKWSGGTLPSSTDVACWDRGATVTISSTAATADSVEGGALSMTGGSLTLTGANDSSLTGLTITGGTLNAGTNDSTINVAGDFDWNVPSLGNSGINNGGSSTLSITQTGTHNFKIEGAGNEFMNRGAFTTPNPVSISDPHFSAQSFPGPSLTTQSTVTIPAGDYPGNNVTITTAGIVTSGGAVTTPYLLHVTGNSSSLGGNLTLAGLTTNANTTLTIPLGDVLTAGSGTISGTVSGPGSYAHDGDAGNIASGGRLSPGSVTMTSGNLTLDSGGTYSPSGPTMVNGGILELDENASTGGLTVTGGDVRGAGGKTLTVSGDFDWNVPNAGSGGFNGGTPNQLTVAQTGSHSFKIEGSGTASLNGGSLTTPNPVTISNTNFSPDNFPPGGSLITQSTVTFTVATTYVGAMTLTAAGLITQRGSTNLPYVVDLTGGTTSVASGSTLDINQVNESGGTLRVDGDLVAPLAMSGGTLKGTGMVEGSVTNNGGTVAPGASPGTLHISNDYTQGAGGTLAEEITGTTPGTQFDQLVVGGALSLDGKLAIDSHTFNPALTDTFKIISGASPATGAFAHLTGESTNNGLNYFPQYDSDGVTLRLSVDRSPPSIAITTPAPAAHYKQGQKVLANYSCSDPDGPDDIALCAGPAPNGHPIDTSTPGDHTFTVQAADKANNSTKKTVHYTVDTTETTPPTVHGFPPDQGCVPGKLKLKISVHPTRLKRAAVFLDGKLIASSTKHDFKVTISGKRLKPGRHQIKILREYKSGTKRRSTFSFTRCKKGGKSPHIHTEGTPDRGSCTAKPFSIVVSITRVDPKTIRVTLDGKPFAKPGKAKFTLKIDVRKLRAGPHKLIIKASDKFKNGSVSITDFVRCA